MKANICGRAWLVPVLALVSLPVPAQELTLFQNTEDGGRAQFQQGFTALEASAPAAALMLKGIYRFGDTYHLSMQSSEGAIYKASWQTGQENSVAVNGYQIQAVDSRTVTMSLPAGASCQQSVQSGSNCIGRGQMALSLAESEPVSTRRGTQRTRENNNTQNFGNNNGRQNAPGAATDIRSLLEAMNGGNDAARAALQELIGNRGRGRGGFPGGDGGNNGANDTAGNNTPAGSNGGGRGGRGGNGGRGGTPNN